MTFFLTWSHIIGWSHLQCNDFFIIRFHINSKPSAIKQQIRFPLLHCGVYVIFQSSQVNLQLCRFYHFFQACIDFKNRIIKRHQSGLVNSFWYICLYATDITKQPIKRIRLNLWRLLTLYHFRLVCRLPLLYQMFSFLSAFLHSLNVMAAIFFSTEKHFMNKMVIFVMRPGCWCTLLLAPNIICPNTKSWKCFHICLLVR